MELSYRNEETSETKKEKVIEVYVMIGKVKYQLSETDEGRLVVNKFNNGGTNQISVYPSCSNEIEIK